MDGTDLTRRYVLCCVVLCCVVLCCVVLCFTLLCLRDFFRRLAPSDVCASMYMEHLLRALHIADDHFFEGESRHTMPRSALPSRACV
jgi:hypothetical protein